MTIKALIATIKTRRLQRQARPNAGDWSDYFLRLYRATLDGFDRESCRIDQLLIAGTYGARPEMIERRARSAAFAALAHAWQDATARYAGEWEQINRGYFAAVAKLRDQGIMA